MSSVTDMNDARMRLLANRLRLARADAMKRLDLAPDDWDGRVGIYADSAAEFVAAFRDQSVEGPISGILLVEMLLDSALHWSNEDVDAGDQEAAAEKEAATRGVVLLRELKTLLHGHLSIMGNSHEAWRSASAHCGRTVPRRLCAPCSTNADCLCGCDDCVGAIADEWVTNERARYAAAEEAREEAEDAAWDAEHDTESLAELADLLKRT